MLSPGQTIGRYRILGELGRGGMGAVFKAEDTRLQRIVALKTVPDDSLFGETRERFFLEARAAAALHHPNIATVFEIEENEGRPIIAMEYVEGKTLEERIAEGPLPIHEAINIARQVATGLIAAHAKGIVHRDVKSGNIVITPTGTAKILDFGLAKVGRSTRLTRDGSTLGTAAYMSPEQARGEEADARSDGWSLGVVLYEMIAGKLPFAADYEQAVTYAILNADPKPLSAVRTGVPLELDRITLKLLSKDRARRYQHLDDFVADLSAVSDAKTAPLEPHPDKEASSMAQTRNGRVITLGITIIAVALAVGVAIWYGGRKVPGSDRLVPPIQLTANPLERGLSGAAVSPDGRYLAYVVASSCRSLRRTRPRKSQSSWTMRFGLCLGIRMQRGLPSWPKTTTARELCSQQAFWAAGRNA